MRPIESGAEKIRRMLTALVLLGVLSAPVLAQNQNDGTPATAPPAPQSSTRRVSELQKAVDEFRVRMGQMGSKAGRASRSGRQNKLTGRIYEYFRNEAMDATQHQVRQAGGEKSLLRRNQFGFSVSGPVLVPKAFDGRGRTFFTLSYEGTRERIGSTSLFTLPTGGQRLGDFSDLVDNAGAPVTIYDPATTRPNPAYDPSLPIGPDNLQYLRDPFPGNRIPLDRIDPVARRLVEMYPLPNTNIGPFLLNNYFVNSPFENRANGVIARVDHAVTDRQQLSANFNRSKGIRKAPELFPGPANSGSPSYSYDNGGLSVQHNYTLSPSTILSLSGGAYYNLTESLDDTAGTDYPAEIGLDGALSTFFPRFYLGNYLSIGPQRAIFRNSSYSYNASSSISFNRKANTLRFTGQYRRSHVNTFSPRFPSGLLYFNSSLTGQPGINNTGNYFASFLLGLTSYAEENLVIHPSYFSKHFVDLNVSDEYRVRPGVTLNMSVSLEVSTPRIEKYDRQSTVSLSRTNPANLRPGALIFAERDGAGRSLQPVTIRLEPSIGLAVNPWNDRRTVVRVNYSLNYSDYPLSGSHFGTQGFNANNFFISPNDQLQPVFLLRNGIPARSSTIPNLDPAAANGTDADYVDLTGLLPANQQWSLSIQRDLPNSMALEARYNGWSGTHQFVDSFIQLNAVPLDNLRFGEQLYDDTFRNSLRPYPQFRNLNLGGLFPGGDVEGHSMTMTFDQRLTGGLFGRVIYRFAKIMDNYSTGPAQDPYNLRPEWSISDQDITHSLQVTYTYELPFGKGKWLLNEDSPFSSVLGGWSLSGLTTMSGGRPLILRPLFNRSGGIVRSLRVNAVPGVDPKVDNPTPERWFNADAFAQPADFTLGNASRTHPSLRGPGEQFHHLSLTKRIEVSSETSIEFVTEAFNFPNLGNLNDPDTRIGSEENPNLNAGRILGTTGGRVMQLGLRILF